MYFIENNKTYYIILFHKLFKEIKKTRNEMFSFERVEHFVGT